MSRGESSQLARQNLWHCAHIVKPSKPSGLPGIRCYRPEDFARLVFEFTMTVGQWNRAVCIELGEENH